MLSFEINIAAVVETFAYVVDALPANIEHVLADIAFGINGEFVLLVHRTDILNFFQQIQIASLQCALTGVIVRSGNINLEET